MDSKSEDAAQEAGGSSGGRSGQDRRFEGRIKYKLKSPSGVEEELSWRRGHALAPGDAPGRGSGVEGAGEKSSSRPTGRPGRDGRSLKGSGKVTDRKSRMLRQEIPVASEVKEGGPSGVQRESENTSEAAANVSTSNSRQRTSKRRYPKSALRRQEDALPSGENLGERSVEDGAENISEALAEVTISSSRSRHRNSRRQAQLVPSQVTHPNKKSGKKSGAFLSGRSRRYQRRDTVKAARDTDAPALTELAVVLIEKLERQEYECMVCFENVLRRDKVWSCRRCYAIFHIGCVRKWAKSSTTSARTQNNNERDSDASWRCPGCQDEGLGRSFAYTCFCGRRVNPESDPGITPHSCGEICGRSRGAVGSTCTHPCTERCHPGPCPPCLLWSAAEACHCGKETIKRKCSEPRPAEGYSCGGACGKSMNCVRKSHFCNQVCHSGSCGDCVEVVETPCFCGKTLAQLPCAFVSVDTSSGGGFACQKLCDGELTCGNHRCEKGCHSPPCGVCALSPQVRDYCACGKTGLSVAEKMSRSDCLSTVPSCGQPCGKPLSCLSGHSCEQICGHTAECGPCQKTVDVLCACGDKVFTLKCSTDEESARTTARCKVVCSDKLNCKRHNCSESCCPERKRKVKESAASKRLWASMRGAEFSKHNCNEQCEKLLNCGLHGCDLDCGHRGDCPTCGYLIREPISCFCGASVIPPPVRCGVEPPECDRPCTKQRSCAHPCPDTCHHGDCEKCVAIVTKFCARHGEKRVVPCFVENVTCGRPCNKPLPCGVHACRRYCHIDPCTSANSSKGVGDSESNVNAPGEGEFRCENICGLPRRPCGHPCADFCHGTAGCPYYECQFPVWVRCLCGRQARKNGCNTELRQGFRPSSDAEKIGGIAVRLACDDVCAQLARNERLAEAIGVERDAKGENTETMNKLEDSIASQQVVADPTRTVNPAAVPIQSRVQVKEAELIKPASFSDFLMDYARSELETVTYLENIFASAVSGSCEGTISLRPLGSLDRACATKLAVEYKMSLQADPNNEQVLRIEQSSRQASRTPKVLLSAARAQTDAAERLEADYKARRRLVVAIGGRVPTEGVSNILSKIESTKEKAAELETVFPTYEVVNAVERGVGGADSARAEVTLQFANPEQRYIATEMLRMRKRFVFRMPLATTSKSFRQLACDENFRAKMRFQPAGTSWGDAPTTAGRAAGRSAWSSDESAESAPDEWTDEEPDVPPVHRWDADDVGSS
ncbi:hypothetical protein NDN08_002893 [Rhodosorus marinus]|uniref:R3H domain-containing protein n=1 Tax=Rhodosorus marinus TaxID=101924 RepID=A0AAV8UV32_9RHOD|nr:hypothetical protein NDN08_002893 [Rhodosorus marinus]